MERVKADDGLRSRSRSAERASLIGSDPGDRFRGRIGETGPVPIWQFGATNVVSCLQARRPCTTRTPPLGQEPGFDSAPAGFGSRASVVIYSGSVRKRRSFSRQGAKTPSQPSAMNLMTTFFAFAIFASWRESFFTDGH